MLRLRLASLDDVSLLRRWHDQPHVAEAVPGGYWAWERELEREVDWREQWIAEVDGSPIGFVQIIDPAREETHYWGDVPEGLRAIDIWIGEPAYLGRGHGTRMMQLTLARCFELPEVTAVVIDPMTTNAAAIRFYERLGFQFVERRRFEEHDCFVYRLDREGYTRHLSHLSVDA